MANLAKQGKKQTGMVKWEDELAKYAQEEGAAEAAPTGSFISFKGGVLKVAGAAVPGSKLNVIVIDHIYENAFYDGAYDPDKPEAPVCYALGRDEKSLAPHETSTQPQHETCEGCPKNQFGSAERYNPKTRQMEPTKGKACKNIRRLALISGDDLTPEGIKNGDVFYAKPPVTSIKGWAYYVKGLIANTKRPTFGYITEIEAAADDTTSVRVMFRPVGPVPDEVMGAVMERRAEVMELISFPYTPAAQAEEPAKPAPKGKARKF